MKAIPTKDSVLLNRRRLYPLVEANLLTLQRAYTETDIDHRIQEWLNDQRDSKFKVWRHVKIRVVEGMGFIFRACDHSQLQTENNYFSFSRICSSSAFSSFD